MEKIQKTNSKLEYSAGGIVLNERKVVVVKQLNTNTWSLPKGHIDKGESALNTAIREIYEETGLSDIKYLRELGSYERGTIRNPSVIKKITFFLFSTTSNLLSPVDKNNPEALWVDIEKVKDILTYPEDKNFFLSVKDSI